MVLVQVCEIGKNILCAGDAAEKMARNKTAGIIIDLVSYGEIGDVIKGEPERGGGGGKEKRRCRLIATKDRVSE